ncbi:MAG TPA: thioredoxin domain-containing protein [archaeon]|nr:thioredoxin domain-containing protein [archaeon]
MNKLEKEKSPFLREAAHHPVNWFPWSRAAFDKAKKEDKPILLDIGAVWCHWCHVMDEESYEDPEIGKIINENFIAVKVDRDERPDLDKQYQLSVQMLSGQGGWPLTVFLTPNLEPFFGGTYFPKEEKYGMPSFKKVLLTVIETFKENKSKVEEQANALLEGIKKNAALASVSSDLKYEAIENSIKLISRNFDVLNGGFGSFPKFPNAEILLLLLRHYRNTEDENVWKIIEITLTKMAEGGIYDQLQGGFHRYSVDEKWMVPHFEKLLSDNALMIKCLTEASQISGNKLLESKAKQSLDFILNEFTGKDGAFYASQDADLDKEEGKYFTWSKKEIEKELGKNAEILTEHFGVKEKGNFEVHGKNILFVNQSIARLSKNFNKDPEEIFQAIEEGKKKLLLKRNERKKSFIDENVVVSWNALMISSLIEAFKVFSGQKYLDAARKAADFLLENAYSKGILFHYYSGRPLTEGFLDDYSFLVSALIDLFEATFEKKYLDKAIELNEKVLELFLDKEQGGFFFSSHRKEELLANEKPFLDFSQPNGNSYEIMNLIRLNVFTGKEKYLIEAEKALNLFLAHALGTSMHAGSILMALEFFAKRPFQIVIIGEKKDPLAQEMVSFLNSQFIPRKVLFVAEQEKDLNSFEVFKGKQKVHNKSTAFVCAKRVCSPPSNSIEQLKKVIDDLY